MKLETYLRKLLGNDYIVYTGDFNSPYINIETPLLDSHNDRIEIYYHLESGKLSDNECYDFDFSIFNADWYKTEYIIALLKVNCVSISDSRELFKIVKGELKTEIENFAKVIQEISNYIVSELPF
jgi:hypothetical protein